MSKQVIHGRSVSVGSMSATTFYQFGSNVLEQWTTQNEARFFWPAAGTFTNFKVDLAVAPGAGKSIAFTLQINGTDTAMVVTIADTAVTGSYTATAISVADGDYLTMKFVPTGTPTTPGNGGVQYSVTFNSTTAKQSCYGCRAQGQDPAGGVMRMPVLTGNSTWTTGAGSTVENVIPCAGSITKMIGMTNSDANGAGEARHFHLYKNGVKQDGAGGTVDTTTTISDPNTSGSATFDLPVVAGDLVYVEVSYTGSPSSARTAVSVRFTATNEGESIMAGFPTSTLLNANTGYNFLQGGISWTMTEAMNSPTFWVMAEIA